jgi:hypothetical protein
MDSPFPALHSEQTPLPSESSSAHGTGTRGQEKKGEAWQAPAEDHHYLLLNTNKEAAS